jgi:hypothetical protein
MEDAVESFVRARSTVLSLATAVVEETAAAVTTASKRKAAVPDNDSSSIDGCWSKRLRSSARPGERRPEAQPEAAPQKASEEIVVESQVASISHSQQKPGLCFMLPLFYMLHTSTASSRNVERVLG